MAEVKVPELAESITEGTIASWLKQKGEYVEQGENILELETDKVNVEIITDESGVLTELKAEEGDTVEVGQVVAIVDENAEEGSSGGEEGKSEEKSSETKEETPAEDKGTADDKSSESEEAPAAEASEPKSDEHVVATPSARKMARERGLSLNDINASDPRGLVRSQDVDNHGKQPAKEETPKKEEAKSQPATKPEKPVIREKMSRRRQTIAKRLHEVSQNTAMLTTFNEVDMTNVMALRKRKKDQFQDRHDGTRLGLMSFFTKAAVAALRKYPAVNAELDGDEMVLKQFYDIGVAVSTEEGLLVPNVRDCDSKTFAQIESDIAELAEKAQNKKLGLDDMTGGSFTITNGGVFGSLMSTPIINGTQAAILGMHTIQKRPVAVEDDKIENRPMMYIALSYDHRIIDGKDSVGFLKTIKDLVENPEDLLLEG